MAKNNALLTRGLIALIRCYRFAVSGFFGHCCRFEPSCSTYAMEALNLHGCLKGACLALRRISRCHPLSPGGLDPVPSTHNRKC